MPAAGSVLLDQALGVADGEAIVDCAPAQLEHRRLVVDGQDRPRVTGAEGPRGDGLLQGRGKLEQADGIGHGWAAATETQGDRLVGEAKGVGEARVGGGLLDGVEILTKEVLAERHLQRVAAGLGRGSEDGGDLGDACLARGAEPALAGDQAVVVSVGLDHDGMEEAVEPDGGRQGGEGGGVELAPRLLGVGADAEGVDLDEDGAPRAHVPGRVAAGQEGVEAAAEAVASRRGGGGRVAPGALDGHASRGAVMSSVSAWSRASRLTASSR